MGEALDDHALKQLFLNARTFRSWQSRDVPDGLLEDLVGLMKMGPTTNNSQPGRITFVRSKTAKERLKPHLDAGNVEKTMTAPVTAIVAYDIDFYAHPPKGQDVLKSFIDKPEWAKATAFRNGSLQGAYLILAARALGLDAGPMSGFNNEGVDREFFSGTSVRSNFLCNLGYGDPAGLRPRGPRFAFGEIARII